jgi:small subunit ribosomal protein S20
LANIKSAQKRIKTNEKRHAKNIQVKSAVRTEAKKVLKSVEAKASGQNASASPADAFKGFAKKIDKAAGKGIIHWKTAARKKSRLAKKVNAAAAK